ncbi:DNA-binding transcriptional LysR family regulator [Rhizobium mesoamericanum]|uniref:LysR family transcriptional regulator n=1 Tax=Rhizobium mesoamericanum TaxID=1079800 RepID=UPI002786A828|nr:LysR family transcriptional regulator [Rhizobium mesoamericanum]MDQ0561977.1 DNA-binding transcriptional LysR family regulator [Rhizobium mesoamericanum]
MDWNDVRVFLAVARAGTLGGAARALKLSQPTMGRRLRALEESTGQVLFQRTADGFILTEEGAAVVAMAEQMEEGALTMERKLAGETQRLEGTLRVSSADWFGSWVLPPVVASFSNNYPHVDIELLTGSRLFSLAQREADVAFRIVPFETADIVQRKLIEMPYGVYVASHQPDPKPGDGQGFRLITMDTSSGSFPDIGWLKELFPNAPVALRTNNRNSQALMCAKGIGIAVLPRPVGDQIAALRRVDLRQAPPTRDIWMGYHRDNRRLGRLRAFVDLAVEHLAN